MSTTARTLAVIIALTVACALDDGNDGNAATRDASPDTGATMAAATQDTGWITLFDGSDLSAWRGYQREDVPAGWQVRDGLLVFDPSAGEGGDLVTRRTFDDFVLELDWRVEPGGNSGVFYRADEDAEVIWHHAPELQLLDDEAHADGASAVTSAGSLYALYPPTEDVVNPAGEWNHVRVVARGPSVEHWLNGTKIVEYEVGSPDWERRVADSKFAEYPEFGESLDGRIGLQDHGDVVWFRDVRIRPIAAGAGREAP